MVSNITMQHQKFYLRIVKWFQVLQCNYNNTIKKQSFVAIQLNDSPSSCRAASADLPDPLPDPLPPPFHIVHRSR